MASDILFYVLGLGAFILPLYLVMKLGETIMQWCFEAQSIVISLPFP